ncbi:hypothetical protein UY3_01195 [Chelonia mydas]|uniref:Uncharacterized protein n=1 Tax=Chelonia mydas TaxID=8469 RepID=M7C097_CHEMY|nr:hypothetical protein UY3_01195 [Chelonia mydas]
MRFSMGCTRLPKPWVIIHGLAHAEAHAPTALSKPARLKLAWVHLPELHSHALTAVYTYPYMLEWERCPSENLAPAVSVWSTYNEESLWHLRDQQIYLGMLVPQGLLVVFAATD